MHKSDMLSQRFTSSHNVRRFPFTGEALENSGNEISLPLYFSNVVTHFNADMKRLVFNFFGGALLAFLAGVPITRAATTNEPPAFKEVYDLIRAHLEGVSAAELDRAANHE